MGFVQNGLHFIRAQARRLIAHDDFDEVGAFVQGLADGVVCASDNAKFPTVDFSCDR